jgi:hypothetical protein
LDSLTTDYHPDPASTSITPPTSANDVNSSIQPVSLPDEALLAEFCQSTLNMIEVQGLMHQLYLYHQTKTTSFLP